MVTILVTILGSTLRWVSIYAMDMFLKNAAQIKIAQIEHRIPIKTAYFLGLGDCQPHSVECMTTPLVDIQTGRAYNYVKYIQYTYISIQYIYLFIYF